MRSTPSSIIARMRASAASTSAAGSEATRARSPRSMRPAATADVGHGEHVAAEHQRLLGEAVAHAGRPDGERLRAHEGAAAQARATGDPACGRACARRRSPPRCWPRAGSRGAGCRCRWWCRPRRRRAPRRAWTGTRRRASSWSGPEAKRVDRVGLRHLGQHHGAVVLGEVERRRDAAGAQGLRERARGLPGQLDQAGVEQRRVLALQQADAPEPVGEGDRHPGALLGEDRGRLLLARGVERARTPRPPPPR